MKRTDIIREYTRFLNETRTLSSGAVLTFGAAMVMHGLREEAGDLDINVSRATFMRIAEAGDGPIHTISTPMSKFMYRYNEYVDIHPVVHIDTLNNEFIEGLLVSSLDSILEQKQALNRAKDQEDIQIIMKAIQGRSRG